MSDVEISKHDRVLLGLVLSLQAAAMQNLGKIKNPLTDAVEKDLEQARGTIDILEMLKAKCRTDTAAEVLRMLDTSVYELQMNYLDEIKRDRATAAESEVTDAAEGTSEPANGHETAPSDAESSAEDRE